jgi:hypothetical protein
MKKLLLLIAAIVVIIAMAGCPDDSGDDDTNKTEDLRTELTANTGASVASDATTGAAEFNGATGLELTAADFSVTGGGTITTVTVDGDKVTVTITFAANTTGTTPKTYTVGINANSTKIKGSAKVNITQAAGSAPPEGPVDIAVTGVTGIPVAKGDWVYIYVDPLEVGITNVILDELVLKHNTTEYAIVDEYEEDDTQGPDWYYVVRKDGGEWQELNHHSDWGDNWQYSTDPSGDEIYFSICSWEGMVTVESGNKGGSKYEVGLAFKAPSAGTITIPGFTAVSHGGDDSEDPPEGDVAIRIEFVHSIVNEYEGDDTQGPAWFYMARLNWEEWQELNLYSDWGDNWQYSEDPDTDEIYFSICTWDGMVTLEAGVVESDDPDNEYGFDVYEIAVAFKAPANGTIVIPDFIVKSHGPDDADDPPEFDLDICIMVNGDYDTWINSTITTTGTGTVTGGTWNVSKGDMLYVYVDPTPGLVDWDTDPKDFDEGTTNVILDNLKIIFAPN